MKPILVTGGAKGIGAAICEALAGSGHDLVIHYNTSEKDADKLIEKCQSFNVQIEKIKGDLSTEKSTDLFIANYLKRFKETKGLVNNVGNYLLREAMETKKEEWLSLIQTNLVAAILLTQALLPQICQNEGNIINLGVNGITHAKTKAAAYHVTKVGLWGYTHCLAKELAPKGVSVNMVSPGHTERSVEKKAKEELPMRRAATLKEVAGTVAFLFSQENHYITGQNIEVAGGLGL